MNRTIEEQVEIAAERRKARNVRDNLARRVLQEHPEIKEDPDGFQIPEAWIPEGTSVAAVRSIARHYKKQKMIRELLNERKQSGDI